jgi:transcription elongation factor Elf1
MLRTIVQWLRGRAKVERAFRCPQCGERRVDQLVWIEDGEAVECQRCGTVYTLEGV